MSISVLFLNMADVDYFKGFVDIVVNKVGKLLGRLIVIVVEERGRE